MIVGIERNRVRLGIEAPRQVPIVRQELDGCRVLNSTKPGQRMHHAVGHS
jgi:sRNA-binding carbon storage regulator CsrA